MKSYILEISNTFSFAEKIKLINPFKHTNLEIIISDFNKRELNHECIITIFNDLIEINFSKNFSLVGNITIRVINKDCEDFLEDVEKIRKKKIEKHFKREIKKICKEEGLSKKELWAIVRRDMEYKKAKES